MWIGISDDTVKLNNLVSEIQSGLDPLGFYNDEKSYHPHITLGRARYPQKHTPDITQFLNTTFAELPMKISRINLMSSQLFSKGAVYTILGTHFLVSKA